jgi:hypothetical protein
MTGFNMYGFDVHQSSTTRAHSKALFVAADADFSIGTENH